ncbi:hypothetical protein GpartN1_g6802.t1 [Galdieria partita]|uniref:RNA polymerase sigma-70 domain-containing protein n=1 Tax=Galdieria partita TaxID=83374 RepID=A0A9C7UTE9_9RHOD|nr:hypothetical protein GpartN1_g6802.t1 [Galdieria partita]
MAIIFQAMESYDKFQESLMELHVYLTRRRNETHSTDILQRHCLLPLFILYFPRRQSNSILDLTIGCYYGSVVKSSCKTRTYEWPCSVYPSWIRSKRKQTLYRQLQRIETNESGRIHPCSFGIHRCWHFFVAVTLLNMQVSTCLERDVTYSIHSSCQTQERQFSTGIKEEYFDSFKMHSEYLKVNDSMLNKTSNRNSSPRLGRSNPFQRPLIEKVQPFLYRKAKHHRLEHTEEQECLSILQTYRQLEEKKMERESALNRRIGTKEWSCLCNISVLDLRKWKKIARQAKHKLISSHLQLVNAVCRDFLRKGLCFDDLVQEGVVGLLKAVEKFDLCKGVRFSTYASWWIRQSLQRAVNQYRHLIRLPVHISDALKAIRRERWFQSYHLNQLPNTRSLSEQTGIPYNKVVYYCRLALLQLPSYSLEEKSVTPHKHSRRQQDTYTCALYDMFLRDDLEQCFSVLEPKERDILCLRYGWEDGKPRTLNEIGCIFQLTEEGVRRIERRALSKIRNCAQVETLKYY